MNTILIFNGSPRKKGNTAVLCDSLAEVIKNRNGKTEILTLNSLNINPCRACDSCMRNKDGMCVQEDDMKDIYGKILDAHGLVFAAPIYWFMYSAQLKLVIDRMYALFGMKGNPLGGKIMAGILVYGGSDEHDSGAINAINALKTMFNYLGGEIKEIIHGTAMDIGDIRKNKILMNKVKELGIKIMQKL
ncbi:MAG: flavodoxin family protein [Promethearchaeota archaeon]|nr:MAG: flavodoxin family protein [Candidatus Lokiarchaeota archaeon]